MVETLEDLLRKFKGKLGLIAEIEDFPYGVDRAGTALMSRFA